MASDRQRSAGERQLGFADGEAFDRRLRERELAGREERMSRWVWGVDEPALDLHPEGSGGPGGPGGYPRAAGELETEVERLRAFYHAVQRSRAWRLTQRLRGMVGRAW